MMNKPELSGAWHTNGKRRALPANSGLLGHPDAAISADPMAEPTDVGLFPRGLPMGGPLPLSSLFNLVLLSWQNPDPKSSWCCQVDLLFTNVSFSAALLFGVGSGGEIDVRCQQRVCSVCLQQQQQLGHAAFSTFSCSHFGL